MRWQGRRQSTNIRDLRGEGGGGFGGSGGGLGGGRPIVVRRAGGGLGIGAILVILVISYFLGINPLELLGGSTQQVQTPGGTATTQASSETRDFVATVLADTEDTWSDIFAAENVKYPEPTLTLFSGSVSSACGYASAATGPFYCPADQNVYIDLSFFEQLRSRFGAPGDFAQAYVLAHEIGHHVQNVLGILDKVHAARNAGDAAGADSVAVRSELQADCFAGIWANRTQKKGLLEAGDIDEALKAAAAVGDDTLQKRSQGYVVPDSFTHGTSAQRAEWFRRGFDQGKFSACDTFSAAL